MKSIALSAAALLLAPSCLLAGDRPWGLPVEVLETKGGRLPAPIEAVRTASGACGVFVFSKDGGLTLQWSKDGRAPWKAIPLPAGLAGDARVEGETVEVILTDFEKKTAAMAVFDFAAGAETARRALPGTFPSTPMFSTVLGAGKDRFAIARCERGEVLVFASADGGKTWAEPVKVAQSALRDDAIAPPLFIAADGLHVVAVEKGGKIRHLLSADRGRTWNDADPVALPVGQADPLAVTGAQDRKRFHAVFLTESGDYVHLGSEDEGKTWGGGTIVTSAKDPRNDLARLYRVKAAGNMVTLAVSESGRSDLHPRIARLFLSADSGKTWAASLLTEGVSGNTGFAAVALTAGGDAWAAFARNPGEGVDGSHHVLFRRLLPEGAAREEFPGDADVPLWWRGGK